MNRNSASHFSATDNRINMGRSKFNRPSWFKGTMNTGDLIPMYLDEVLPGDTFEMNTSVLCRMATPVFPVMDNSYLDTYFFFVPMRLVWDHTKEFFGENDVNAWTQEIEYAVPKMAFRPYGQDFTVADYFGLPIGNAEDQNFEIPVNVLPFRSYHLIYNDYFRDQNLQNPVLIDKGDVVDSLDIADLLKVRKANKFHDYFTSALPAPQKGAPVVIPGLSSMPVSVSGNVLTFANVPGPDPNDGGVKFNTVVTPNSPNSGSSGLYADDMNLYPLVPNNLFADAGLATGATIDALRTAFQIQKLLWRDGIGGTRYTEIIRSHFGVVSPDARLQRPEYLGGKRIPLTMNQVVQTSSTDETSPLGNTGAYSKTVDSFNGFTKSFTEHGYIIGLAVVRTDHTYQNGVNRLWSRTNRFDFYYPELANIGEQAILNKEIYVSATDRDDEVFGYQEAWAEYRYRPSFVTSAFRSNYDGGSLDAWHYADDYESAPFLSSEWIQEPVANVERTLAVQTATERHEQILLDCYFDCKTTRPMPVYSIPGLVDHF